MSSLRDSQLDSVVHVSQSDAFGGAAKAAFRLHQGLLRTGVVSRMLVENQSLRSDPTISELRPPLRLEASLVERYYIGTRRCGRLSNTGFSVDPLLVEARRREIFNNETLSNASIVNLHWVAGLLSPAEIADLAASEKPLVWTMHDMRPITGGCHFSDNCEGFREGCSHCPQLRDDPCGLVPAQFETCLTTYGALEWTAVCPSAWLASCVRQSRIGQGKRVETIPYGLDENVFRPREKCAACAALNLNSDVAYLCVGAHWLSENRKGVAYVNEVLKMMASDAIFGDQIRRGSWQLVSFGNDQKALDSSGWRATSFACVESEERLSQIFAASSVLLFCSLADNLPNTLIEASASGLPAVAMRAGGVEEVICDSKNGFLVPQGETREAGNCCGRLLQDRLLQRKMGEAARDRAGQLYTLEGQAHKYRSLYEDLLASRKQPHIRAFVSLARCDAPPRKESWRSRVFLHSLKGADATVSRVQAESAEREKKLKQDITALWKSTRGFSLRRSIASALGSLRFTKLLSTVVARKNKQSSR